MDDNKKYAAILARVSREIQDTESQIADLKEDVKKFGYKTNDDLIFQEKITGMDSFDKDERKSLQELKNALSNNPHIKTVFMWELSRLSRNPYFLIEQLRWFNEQNIAIYFHEEDKWTRNPTTNEEDLSTTQFIFGAATGLQAEWKKIRERTKRGRDNKAKKGLYVGHIADGYRVELKGNEKTFAIDEERAAIIRSIFDMYVSKRMSTNEISRYLNDSGVLTFNANEAVKNKDNETFCQTYKKRGTAIRIEKSKTKWTGSSVSQILKNRWYIGERQYKGDTYHIPPIISESIFFKTQKMLKENASICIKKTSGIYPLRSLLFCGKCGRQMYGHRVHCYSTYYCSSIETGKKCGEEGICKENIDGIVWNIISNIAFSAYLTNENIVDKLRDIFGYDRDSEETIKNDIKRLTKIIEQKRSQNKKLGSNIATYAFNIQNESEDLRPYFNKELQKLKQEYSLREREIEDLSFEVDEKENLLNKSENIDIAVLNQLTMVATKKDIRAAARLIQILVERVTLFNFPNHYKLIEIMLHSQKRHYALYNSKKHRGMYSILPPIIYNPEKNSFSSTKPLLYLRSIKNELNDTTSNNGRNKRQITSDELDSYIEDPTTIDKLCSLNKDFGFPILYHQFSFPDILQYVNNECDWIEIERIEDIPDTEEYRKWRQQQRYFQKKYNKKKKEQRDKVKTEELKQFSNYLGRIQIAEELHISKSKVWQDLTHGILHGVKVKGIWKIAPDEVKRYALLVNRG